MTRRIGFPSLVALCFALVLTGPPAVAQTIKVGVFSAQRLTSDTAEGAKIQARLTALQERKTADLKLLQEEIDRLQQEFVQSAASGSDEKRKELTLKIQRKQDELENAKRAAARELQLEIEAAENDWQRRVLALLGEYGREKGFTMILPADVVAYFAPAVDVTDDLIKLIDERAAAPAPAAAAPSEP